MHIHPGVFIIITHRDMCVASDRYSDMILAPKAHLIGYDLDPRGHQHPVSKETPRGCDVSKENRHPGGVVRTHGVGAVYFLGMSGQFSKQKLQNNRTQGDSELSKHPRGGHRRWSVSKLVRPMWPMRPSLRKAMRCWAAVR